MEMIFLKIPPLKTINVPKGAVAAYEDLKGKGLPQNVNITEIQ